MGNPFSDWPANIPYIRLFTCHVFPRLPPNHTLNLWERIFHKIQMRASMFPICKTVSNLCECIFQCNDSGTWMHVEKTLIYSTHSKGSKLTNQRTKDAKIIKLYRLISKYKPTGLKACLESWISIDIDNFLLVNILQRHLGCHFKCANQPN